MQHEMKMAAQTGLAHGLLRKPPVYVDVPSKWPSSLHLTCVRSMGPVQSTVQVPDSSAVPVPQIPQKAGVC